jgi:hypothetical protein
VSDLVQSAPATRMLYLFATTRGTVPSEWAANRLVLLGAATVLFGLAGLVLTNAEFVTAGEGA